MMIWGFKEKGGSVHAWVVIIIYHYYVQLILFL